MPYIQCFTQLSPTSAVQILSLGWTTPQNLFMPCKQHNMGPNKCKLLTTVNTHDNREQILC